MFYVFVFFIEKNSINILWTFFYILLKAYNDLVIDSKMKAAFVFLGEFL